MQRTRLGLDQTLAAAPELLPAFQPVAAAAPYEDKGVLFSEMFFVLASVAHLRPRRIFESGRARGVSTCLLGQGIPGCQIVSVECDAQSPVVPVAAANLSGMKHVECLFGDAQRLLPARVQPGDVVVIDGPKHFRALRLALRLLRDQRPAAVFIHDCHLGSVERDFLGPHVPTAFYSDQSTFVDRYRFLDEKCWALRKQLGSDDFPFPGQFRGKPSSYGPTFACLLQAYALPCSQLLARAAFAGLRHRLQNSLAKLAGKRPG